MRKSQKILIHVLFWFYFLNQQLFGFYIGKPGENADILHYLYGFGLYFLIFYIFYFSIHFFLN